MVVNAGLNCHGDSGDVVRQQVTTMVARSLFVRLLVSLSVEGTTKKVGKKIKQQVLFVISVGLLLFYAGIFFRRNEIGKVTKFMFLFHFLKMPNLLLQRSGSFTCFHFSASCLPFAMEIEEVARC